MIHDHWINRCDYYYYYYYRNNNNNQKHTSTSILQVIMYTMTMHV